MTKRTFVLFLCLINALAFSLFSEQAVSVYDKVSHVNAIVSDQSSFSGEVHFTDFCGDRCCETAPIIQAHTSEWKENLSNLLRHRHSSYRFLTFESVHSVSFHFAVGSGILSRVVQPGTFLKGVVTLPDYYSFLHRLCPF